MLYHDILKNVKLNNSILKFLIDFKDQTKFVIKTKCKCRTCINRRNRAKGRRKQNLARKKLGIKEGFTDQEQSFLQTGAIMGDGETNINKLVKNKIQERVYFFLKKISQKKK